MERKWNNREIEHLVEYYRNESSANSFLTCTGSTHVSAVIAIAVSPKTADGYFQAS